jgi:type III secretion system YscQ/HrcQ family protein
MWEADMARKKVEEDVEEEDIEIEDEEGDDEEEDDAEMAEADSDEETEVDDDNDDEGEDTSPDFDAGMAGLAADVPVQVVAVLGKRSFSMQDLMKFHVGQVVDLYRPANETVDLVVGGKLIAKGELVSIDGKLGVKILKLI